MSVKNVSPTRKKITLREKNLDRLPHSILKKISQNTIAGLDLHHNNLKEIPRLPTEVCELNLEYLDVSSNDIEKIDRYVLKFENLKDLSIADNPITEVPEFLIGLDNLEYLNISETGVRSLPEDLGNKRSLKELDIFFSDIKELPEIYCRRWKLKTLEIESDRTFEELCNKWNL